MSTPVPTFWQVAARPRWVGVLAACIAVAIIFAILGQWQISRAVEQGQRDERDTETAVPLSSVAQPGEALTTEAGGRMVEAEIASLSDARVLAGRRQNDRTGWWVIARATVPGDQEKPASLAVALGWSADEARAREAVEALAAETGTPRSIVGRYNPSEAPTDGDYKTGASEAMSLASLVNEWPDWNGSAYTGYLLLDPAASGLATIADEPIVSRPPEQNTQLNWLNVFYAAEWIAFMAFALYLWTRLVRDARERDIEAIEDAQGRRVLTE